MCVYIYIHARAHTHTHILFQCIKGASVSLVYHLSLNIGVGISEGCFIFDSAHLAYHVHKSGRSTSIIGLFCLLKLFLLSVGNLNYRLAKNRMLDV